jgi:hypothetical protein
MKSQVIRLTSVVGAVLLAATAAKAQFADSFETYTTGSDITGQGGWAQWDNNPIVDNAVSTAFAHTGSKSLQTELHADKVHDFSFTAGRWNWSVWTYVPSTTTLPQWGVFLSSYNPGGPYFWVAQVELDPTLGQIRADMGPNAVCGGTPSNQLGLTAPLVTNAWAELSFDIDLTADRAQTYYNGQPVGQIWQYTDGIVAGFGLAQIGTIDLYANDNTVAGDRVYWDDVTVTANTSTIPLDCHGVSSTYCTAGQSTNGCLPQIATTGTPSASAVNGFQISASLVEGQKTGIFFYGVTGQIAAQWGTGSSFLCVKAPTQRTATQGSGGTTNQCDGNFTLDWNAYMAGNGGAVGNPRFFGEQFDGQFWYRDPPAPKTTNLTGGVHWVLNP